MAKLIVRCLFLLEWFEAFRCSGISGSNRAAGFWGKQCNGVSSRFNSLQLLCMTGNVFLGLMIALCECLSGGSGFFVTNSSEDGFYQQMFRFRFGDFGARTPFYFEVIYHRFTGLTGNG